jgi:hypothetical protein
VLVAQADRQAVELQFGDVVDRRVAFLEAHLAPHPGVEVARAAASMSVSVRIDSMGTRWPHLGEGLQRLAADALRGRVGRQQRRVPCSSSCCSSRKELVVFGVGIAGASST